MDSRVCRIHISFRIRPFLDWRRMARLQCLETNVSNERRIEDRRL